jgi:hypothetical protein
VIAVLAVATYPHVALSSSDFLLYLYGATWCPYCRALSDFFSRNFPNNSYFCKIDLDEGCSSALRSLSSYLASKGAPSDVIGYIPLTLVVVRGKYVAAVVVGAVTDADFWRGLAGQAPSERVPVMLGRDRVYEVALTYDEQAKLVSSYVRLPTATTTPLTTSPLHPPTVTTEVKPQPSGLQLEPRVLAALALVLAGAALIAYSLVRRR